MPASTFLVVIITLVLAAAFLFIWMRRDRGEFPQDRLPASQRVLDLVAAERAVGGAETWPAR